MPAHLNVRKLILNKLMRNLLECTTPRCVLQCGPPHLSVGSLLQSALDLRRVCGVVVVVVLVCAVVFVVLLCFFVLLLFLFFLCLFSLLF